MYVLVDSCQEDCSFKSLDGALLVVEAILCNGTGWPRDKGGISVTLDSLPVPGKDGKVSMLIVDADAKSDAKPADKPRRDEMDDEVPF